MRLGPRLAGMARHVWAAPCSLVGLLLAAPLVLLGGRARRVAGTLEVTWRERVSQGGALAQKLPFRAMALGHVIVALTAEELVRSRAHERVHVAQYERWGLLFFVAYAASSAWQWLKGGRPYWDNHFEVDARRRSGPDGV